MYKVLVTGGTGFLGKSVTRLLRNKDYMVETCSKSQGVDILDYEFFRDFVGNMEPDMIIHCAAHVGGIAYNALHPIEVFEDNVKIGINVIKAANEMGVKNLINVIPNCSYPGHLDEYEESKFWEGAIHESVLTYGLPRKMGWGLCFAYCQKNKNFKPVHLIFPNMYGPNDHFQIIRSHALGALIKKIVDAKDKNNDSVEIWGTGRPIREWIYVEDSAMAILKTIENFDNFEPNEIMNIGVTKGISVIDLANLIKEKVNWQGKFVIQTDKPDGAMKKVLIVNKMKEKLKWEPPTELEEGIEKTVKWYQENKHHYKDN